MPLFKGDRKLFDYFFNQLVTSDGSHAMKEQYLDALDESSPYAIMYSVAKAYSKAKPDDEKAKEVLEVAENLNAFGKAYKSGNKNQTFTPDEFEKLSKIYDDIIKDGSRYIMLKSRYVKDFNTLSEFSDVIKLACGDGDQLSSKPMKTELEELGECLRNKHKGILKNISGDDEPQKKQGKGR